MRTSKLKIITFCKTGIISFILARVTNLNRTTCELFDNILLTDFTEHTYVFVLKTKIIKR